MSTSGGVGGRAPRGALLPDLFARHVMRVGGGSPLRAVMVGTARAGQGVHREVESEGSRSPKLGLDEQKPDTRPVVWGNAAMDADAR